MKQIFCIAILIHLTNSQYVRKAVKLTMKQGLLMNQILSNYALDSVEDSVCKNHTEQFKNGLRAFEPWALKMFDSSSKIQSGVLLGNLVEFGSFRQCLQIKSGAIYGKHCLIKVTPTLNLIKKILTFRNISPKRFLKVKVIVQNSALFWSVCVPASCSTEDVLKHFQKIVEEVSHGLNLSVSLSDSHCITDKDRPKMDWRQYFTLLFLTTFIIVSLISTVIQSFNGVSASSNRILMAFSIKSNFLKITTRKSKNDLDCIHGLRVLSTCYVVIGHRYLMAMFFPVINGLEILDWVLNYSSTLIIGGTICVDTFFLISGMLVSIGFFKSVTKNGNFNVMIFYMYRYIRVTFPLAIVVLIYATLIEFLGEGPLWRDTCKAHLEPCKHYWWSTLLHIQSYVNPGSFCILQTWYLTCDMIYYIFSPVILYPLWKFRICGFINFGIVYVLSVIINFYLAWINQYEGGMPITNQLLETDYFKKHYVTPHTRAAPYVIGLGLGYCIYQLKDRKIKIGVFANLCGWIIALSVLTAVVVGCHTFQLENHDYSRLEASIFLSCSRSAWAVGLVWIIWSCINGQGGIINDFLSCTIFRILGNISYGIFLLHMIVEIFKSAASKNPTYFSNWSSIYESTSDLSVTIFISFFFTLFFELPLTRLQSIFFEKKKIESG